MYASIQIGEFSMEAEFNRLTSAEVRSALQGAFNKLIEADEGSGDCELVLVSRGQRPIEVIKTIREYTGLGLKEAKDLSEQPFAVIRKGSGALPLLPLMNALDRAGATTAIRGAFEAAR